MSVRAASLASLLPTLVAAQLCAAAPTQAPGTVPGTVGEFPSASDIRVGGDETQTRIVVDLSQRIEFRAFALANPYRVVIDIPQVAFRLPSRAGETARGLVKAFRFGLVMPGGSRIVIDLARPARIDRVFMIDPANDQPARLVLDLTAVDRDSFMRMVSIENRLTEGAKAEPHPDARSDAKSDGDPRPLIVLDPGHGGIDNGTRAASGEMEKTIVLEFCLLVRDKIEKTGKYRVAMTRTDDSFVPLGERVAFARGRKAALFISVHADALARGEGDAQGATVYTLSERPSDARAARLAESENQADAIAGLDLSSEPKDVAGILVDLARRETKTFSAQLAQGLVAEMKNATRLHQNPLKSAAFVVLKAPDIPSVLVELGFVSNKSDIKSLVSPEWRERTSDSMVHAVDIFLTTRLAGNGQN